jgi:hypothetical protein
MPVFFISVPIYKQINRTCTITKLGFLWCVADRDGLVTTKVVDIVSISSGEENKS